MQKSRNNNVIIALIVAIIFVVSLVVFILNYSRDDYSFSLVEKKWIKDNTSKVIDVSVYNDVPIYGQNGMGIIFDYLDKFTTDYNIAFNKVSYETSMAGNAGDVAFRIVDNDTKLTDNDILMYEDNYVVVTKEDTIITGINDLTAMKLGVMTHDVSAVNYYLHSDKNVVLTTYNDEGAMYNALSEDEVEGLIIPKIMSLNKIFRYDLYITYHVPDISKKYVLTINNNDTLLGIMRKYNKTYMEEYFDTSYKDNYRQMLFDGLKITEEEIASYNSNPYTFGYTMYMPYTYEDNHELVGTISNYLQEFEEYFNIDFKIRKYNNINTLSQALSRGEVDLAFGNFNTDNLKIKTMYSTSPFDEEYVVLSKDNTPITSIRSLYGYNVYTVEGTLINSMLNKNNITVVNFDNTDELLRNIKNDSIVVIDKSTYDYYQKKKFNNYHIIYQGTLDEQYRFITRDISKNTTFNKLFNKYVELTNYDQYRNKYNTTSGIAGSGVALMIAKYVVLALIIIAIITTTIILVKRKKQRALILKKEEKLKFIDVMTSLKNRNYLNYNMKIWEENVIYPQAIVIIDLNNINYINDNYGHEEGDIVIKKAASILIVNQLENTDIIRTDGNEFLIYMVGYAEKDVITLIRTLKKLMQDLPHGYGASLGYSMITDDVKTIDDAINEATIDMREGKNK